MVDSSDDEDEEEEWKDHSTKRKKKKLDVMGKCAGTGDRLGMSVRQKSMYAASAVSYTHLTLPTKRIV